MRGKEKEQKGIALVTALLFLLIVTILGVVTVNNSALGLKISANTKVSKQTFFVAEAGAEVARELLRAHMAAGHNLSYELNQVKGADGVLTDSLRASNFSVTDDIPFIHTTSFGNGSYTVYLTNDAADGVNSVTDTNGIVTLTSLATGLDNSRAVVQITTKLPMQDIPGAIVMAGPNVTFDVPSSNTFRISGVTMPAIAVTSTASQTTILNSIPADRTGNYTGTGGTPSVQVVTLPFPWDNITSLQNLYATLKSNADFTSPRNPGFTLGSETNMEIVVIDGDYSLTGTGGGILLVTGQLTLSGNFSYYGLLLAIGQGRVVRTGGGNGTLSGSIYLAKIDGPDGIMNTADDVFGNPHLDWSGGGNSTTMFSSGTQEEALKLTSHFPLVKNSWKQLSQ